MSIDTQALRDVIDRHGPVTRVVVADVKGSAPREVGASMIVWKNGQTGTIGGGALEYEAAKIAEHQLSLQSDLTRRFPLGPELGQCCGGSVTLRFDVIDMTRLSQIETAGIFARGKGDAPLWVQRLDKDHRAVQLPDLPKFQNNWMIEVITPAKTNLWIWGAGHVGRALVDVLTPMDRYDVTWVDVDESRFPAQPNSAATIVTAQNPADLVRHVPPHADHIIVTYSHVLDLDLCHGLLAQNPKFLGLIGSKTKWVRFQKRLRDLGHSTQDIARITCPIGDPSLGKHPQTIAISVANGLLKTARDGIHAQGERTYCL